MVELPDWSHWADTVESDWTWPLGPRTRACWATPEQSVWFCCMGSPATFPPLCPRWLLVGRHRYPDLPRTGWVNPLPMPRDLELVTQTVAVCCWIWWQTGQLGAGATENIWLGRPLGEGTILFEWFGLVWIACLLSHSASLGSVEFWGLPVSWCTRSGFSTEGHTEGPTSSPLFVDIGKHCCVVCGHQDYVVWKEVWELF